MPKKNALPADAGAPATAMVEMDDAALDRIAQYFRALSEPMRLKILNALRSGECNVTELTQRLGTGQANTSKHLSTLLALGVVARSARGTSSYYRIADPSIYGLCDLVCGQIGRQITAQELVHRSFLAPEPAPALARRRTVAARRQG